MSDKSERLQRWLARAGAAPSRRKAEAWIVDGRVTVNGEVAQLGSKVPPGAEVRLDDTPITRAGRATVLMLHKPAGVLSSVGDDRGRRTVMDLVPAVPGLHPVGRLDLDSEGLLLLTDDGELTQRLTHPRYQ
ncbi:MAG: S4 domain-containing protein, partial [Trueperaceae bacterium]